MKRESGQQRVLREMPSGPRRQARPRTVRAREKKRAAWKQAGAGKKGEGRKEEKGRAARPPAGQCGKGEKKDWARTWGRARMEEGNFFFKNKTFSKSIFSIFNSKPNSNRI